MNTITHTLRYRPLSLTIIRIHLYKLLMVEINRKKGKTKTDFQVNNL